MLNPKNGSYWNAPDDVDGYIYIESDIKDHKIGDKIKVKIEKAFVYDLFGKEVK